jgi:hypothetical protein
LPELTIFFDRCTGSGLPKLLRKTNPPFLVEFHDEKKNGFAQTAADDEWLSIVSQSGWIVASHDRRFHSDNLAAEAIRQHNGRVFYFPYASSPLWYKLHIFICSYRKMCGIVQSQQAPWIYSIAETGRIARLKGI